MTGSNNAAAVKQLLDAKADVNAVDQTGTTPLMLADRSSVSLLLERKASLAATNQFGWSGSALCVFDRTTTKEQRKAAFATVSAAASTGAPSLLASLALYYMFGFDAAIISEPKVAPL